MSNPWRAVAGGLERVGLGVKLAGWSLAAGFGLIVLCGLVAVLVPALDFLSLSFGVVLLTLLMVGVGRLICTIGRWMCLSVPEDASVARGRIRLAIVFETCGVLGGCAALGFLALDLARVPVPVELGMSAIGFSFLTTVIGRIGFFRFAQAVGDHVDREITSEARRLVFISLVAVSSVVVAYVLAAVAERLGSADFLCRTFSLLANVVAVLLLFVVVISVFTLLFAHFALVSDLRQALSKYTSPVDENDPDQPYLVRYIAGDTPDNDVAR